VLLAIGWSLSVLAAGTGTSTTPAATKPAVEEGARWQDLRPGQQLALKPLERDWAGIDLPRKQKWLELSVRFPRLSAEEQSRVQARMAEWAKLTPQQRGQARINFQEAKRLPAQDRQARWESYQALSPEQKKQLAARAMPASSPAVTSSVSDTSRKPAASSPLPMRAERADKPAREVPQAKSNIVPNPAFAAQPKQIAPTVVQAGPGATTTLISKRPTPPSHQQTGLPKIAATPEFVDKATLLPQRGPQAAATRAAKSSEAEGAPRQ
jgi:Protein of unknown function (DUF3106)